MADLGSIGFLQPSIYGNGGVSTPAPAWGGAFLQKPFINSWAPPEEVVRWETYVDRPVFGWEIDWATTPFQRLELVLNEMDAGFGDVAFWRDQLHVVHGWQFAVPLTGDDIRDVEDFIGDLHGRRAGFWVQTPVQAFRIVQGVSGNRLLIRDRAMAETWEDLPSVHVAFTKRGQPTQRQQVTAVVDMGDGTERVDLGGATEMNMDHTWQAWVLAYVRLSDDVERGSFEGEGALYRTFRVVELPHEYASYELGERPVYLYHFRTEGGGSPVDWRLTSFAWDLDDGTNTWTAARITHGAIRRSMDPSREQVQIEAELDPASPLFQLCPPALAMPLLVTIYEADYTALETKTVIATGRVLGPVEVDGKTVKAGVDSILDLGGGNLPAMVFQPRCNYRLFEAGTCRVDRAAHEVAVTITTMNNRTLVVNGAGLSGAAVNHFAEGFIETGSGNTFERRTILASTVATGSTVTITLNAALYFAEETDAAVLLPGCDGLPDTCITKFNNFDNFGGHRAAFRNLAIKGLETPEIDAAKK